MNSRKPLLTLLTTGALVFAGTLLAQNAPSASGQSMPSTTKTATYQTPQGVLTVRSSPAPAPDVGSAPSFEQLSGGGKTISEKQAATYPPLANDFIHADRMHNGHLTKAEYNRWTKHLGSS